MIQIKTQELRDAVQATYEFDKEYGLLITAEGDCNSTWKNTYSFDVITRTYYFEGLLLTAYEDVV